MNPFVAEFIGTGILLLMGSGVVANVLLPQTKGHSGGLIAITTAWALGVFLWSSRGRTLQWCALKPSRDHWLGNSGEV